MIKDFNIEESIVTCTCYYNGVFFELHFGQGKLINSYSSPVIAKESMTNDQYNEFKKEAEKLFEEKYAEKHK